MPENKLDSQVPLELDDGTTSAVADSSDVNAVKETSPVDISFASGNYEEFLKLGQCFSRGIISVSNTLIPLLEAGLIELLGNSSAFERTSAIINSKVVGNSPIFEFKFLYKVSLWIGTDIKKEAVLQDATYVYNKLNIIPNTKFDECKIDTANGQLSIEGSLTAV